MGLLLLFNRFAHSAGPGQEANKPGNQQPSNPATQQPNNPTTQHPNNLKGHRVRDKQNNSRVVGWWSCCFAVSPCCGLAVPLPRFQYQQQQTQQQQQKQQQQQHQQQHRQQQQ